jgi:hypothetical protein
MEIIGLSGYARTGKDEAAKVLVEEFGFNRVAFADKLRDVLYALNPMVGIEGEPYEGGLDMVGVQMVIDRYGWNGYKETEHGNEIRRLLQRLGTEAGRQTLWDSIWVDAAFADLSHDARVVVTDARFENEAKAIKERGGTMWRINRQGVGPVNDHPSETSLDLWAFDMIINNNNTIEAFHRNVRNGYRYLKLGAG